MPPRHLSEIKKQLPDFRSWLQGRGSVVHEPTNQYEVLRFDSAKGVGIIYRKECGRLTWPENAVEAWNAFQRRDASCDLFLFKGLLRCGHCGSPMYTVPGGKAGPVKDYYYCRTLHDSWKKRNGPSECPSGYLRRVLVERAVSTFITENLANKGYILEHLEEMFSQGRDLAREREVEDIKSRLSRMEKKRKRALDLHLDGILEREDLDTTLAEVSGEVLRLEARLESLVVPRPSLGLEDMAEAVVQRAESFALFPLWSPEDQKRFLALERPQFWIQDMRVTRFMLPLGCKKERRMGKGSWPPPA